MFCHHIVSCWSAGQGFSAMLWALSWLWAWWDALGTTVLLCSPAQWVKEQWSLFVNDSAAVISTKGGRWLLAEDLPCCFCAVSLQLLSLLLPGVQMRSEDLCSDLPEAGVLP